MTRNTLVAIALTLIPAAAPADEKLKDVACRSVHLSYPAAAGTAFYNELAVDTSAPGTYFMACGWDAGYFGIQELANGKKLAIFSVWDSNKTDDKYAVKDKDRVKLVHKHAKTRVGRFGGEGTGGQSFHDVDWKAGETYRFLVTSKPDGDRTEYAGYLYFPAEKDWRHLVTFSTITGGKNLKGYYSFIEDFKRDKVSATKPRAAHFGNGWVRAANGDEWVPLLKAKFTADANPVINIDAGIDGSRFTLATGGATANAGQKLKAAFSVQAAQGAKPPPDLPK